MTNDKQHPTLSEIADWLDFIGQYFQDKIVFNNIVSLFFSRADQLRELAKSQGTLSDNCKEKPLKELTLLLTACNRLILESEEFEFDDGIGRGALNEYWDDLEEAFDTCNKFYAAILEDTHHD